MNKKHPENKKNKKKKNIMDDDMLFHTQKIKHRSFKTTIFLSF